MKLVRYWHFPAMPSGILGTARTKEHCVVHYLKSVMLLNKLCHVPNETIAANQIFLQRCGNVLVCFKLYRII